MENEIIPYEQALELKHLGFEYISTIFAYNESGGLYTRDGIPHDFNIRGLLSAPTFSQVFRWFREKYNLIFQINYLFNGNYQVVIHKNTHEYMELIQYLNSSCVYEIPDNYSYEEAELECLKKLIEIVKDGK